MENEHLSPIHLISSNQYIPVKIDDNKEVYVKSSDLVKVISKLIKSTIDPNTKDHLTL